MTRRAQEARGAGLIRATRPGCQVATFSPDVIGATRPGCQVATSRPDVIGVTRPGCQVATSPPGRRTPDDGTRAARRPPRVAGGGSAIAPYLVSRRSTRSSPTTSR
jgi:hypothetical protein